MSQIETNDKNKLRREREREGSDCVAHDSDGSLIKLEVINY